jgi:hypothetical protein
MNEKQMQQLGSQYQKSSEQGQFYFVGRPRLCLIACRVLDQFLEITAKLAYNLSRVGRHRLPPFEDSWLVTLIIFQGVMSFNSLLSRNVYSISSHSF